jgi:hypothetical protein
VPPVPPVPPGPGTVAGRATSSDKTTSKTTPLPSGLIRLALTVAAAENNGIPEGGRGIIARAVAASAVIAAFTRVVNGPDNAPEKSGASRANNGVDNGVINPGESDRLLALTLTITVGAPAFPDGVNVRSTVPVTGLLRGKNQVT